MKKIKYLPILLFAIILFYSFNNIRIYADESEQLYTTDGFTVSDEFLKVLSNPKTGYNLENGTVRGIDSNKDGVISLKEVEGQHILDLDVSNCTISDWSDLKYFKNLTELIILNADFSKCSFGVIPSNCNVRNLKIQNSSNCDKISGLNKFPTLEYLSFEECDTLSCTVLFGIKTLSSLNIQGTEITNQSYLSSVKINSLTIKSPSVKKIGFTLPNIDYLRTLNVSKNELDYLVGGDILNGLTTLNASYNNISILISLINRVHIVDFSWNNIKDIDWYVHSDTVQGRIVNLYGNPLSNDAMKEILEYNFDFESIFDGKEGEEYLLELNSQSPFRWMTSDKLQFEVEDSSIISISNGVIKLLKPGITNVNVYCSNGVEGIDYCISYPVKVWGINETPSPTPMITRRPTEAPSLVPTAAPSIVPTEIPVKIGDVNTDGNIDAIDALNILKISAKLINGDAYLADITEDDVVNADDALMVLKIAAKLM